MPVSFRRGVVALLALAAALRAGASPSPCDATTGTWCDAVGTTCSAQAGTRPNTACDVRVADQWTFNEGTYCAGCTYTFYVLVECGRAMHLPLADMEGARITVTEVLAGRPATLHCLNDAAKGNPPEVIRCVGPNSKTGYGPPFDQTVNAGDAMQWGFPDCVSIVDLTCDDVPAGGGTVDRLSPGELQTMDCEVTADNGLCGLYRVDVQSGGFQWDLFANCDGSPSPQFQIFYDCQEALAAFHPRPELALTALSASGHCPTIDVSFEVQNLGCADYDGDVPVRIVSNCVPPETLDVVVPGPLPANGSVTFTTSMTVSCDATLTLSVDPDDTIPECTESSGVASCNQATGVRSLQATVDCCAATLDPRTSDVAACARTNVVLDGSASSITGCASPLYRWLDDMGGVVRDWDPDPNASVVVSCPDRQYALEASCDGEICTRATTAWVRCIVPTALAGPDVASCPGAIVRLDGSASAVTNCANPEYAWLLNGSIVQDWSSNPVLDLGTLDCTEAGPYTLEVRCNGHLCADADGVIVTCTGAGSGPPEATDLHLSKSGNALTFRWSPPAAAVDGYRVARGTIAGIFGRGAFDHAADGPAGQGACDAGDVTTWTDPDDATRDGSRWYYLVIPWTQCGGDGPAGFGRLGATRPPEPPRIPTASCP